MNHQGTGAEMTLHLKGYIDANGAYVTSPLYLIFVAVFIGLLGYNLAAPGTILPLVLGVTLYGLLICTLFEPLVEVLIWTKPNGNGAA